MMKTKQAKSLTLLLFVFICCLTFCIALNSPPHKRGDQTTESNTPTNHENTHPSPLDSATEPQINDHIEQSENKDDFIEIHIEIEDEYESDVSPLDILKEEKPKKEEYLKAQQLRKYTFSMHTPPPSTSHVENEDANVTRAIELLMEAAEAGNDDAMFTLGEIYEFGELDGFSNFSAAIFWYEKAARSGNPHAQFSLGFIHSTGKGVPINNPLGLLYFTFAAEGGSLEAQMTMGYKYMLGLGVPKDCTRSAANYEIVAGTAVAENQKIGYTQNVELTRLSEEYEKSGDQVSSEEDVVSYYQYAGDSSALVHVGTMHLQGAYRIDQDYAKALEFFRKAAQQGSAAAMSSIGFMYQNGYGVAQDNTTALKWYKQAAEKKNAHALTNLGLMYLKGWGVTQSDVEAFKYFNQASELGFADGHLYLGHMYFNGWYVKRDLSKAINLYTAAGQQGNIGGLFALGQVHLMGQEVSAIISPNCQISVTLFKKVAEKGTWNTLLQNGFDLYENDDYERALLLYERGAIMGYEVAQSNAAFLYDKRLGTSVGVISKQKAKNDKIKDEKEHEKEQKEEEKEEEENLSGNWEPEGTFFDQQAYRYFSLSADQNNPEARLKLGDYHYYGVGTTANLEQAAECYMQAHNMRNPQATFNLGYMHEFGKGLPKDLFLAKRYYDLTLVNDPEAFLPVGLALIGLGFHFAHDYLLGDLVLPSSGTAETTDEKNSEVIYESELELDTILILILGFTLGFVLYLRQRALLRQ